MSLESKWLSRALRSKSTRLEQSLCRTLNRWTGHAMATTTTMRWWEQWRLLGNAVFKRRSETAKWLRFSIFFINSAEKESFGQTYNRQIIKHMLLNLLFHFHPLLAGDVAFLQSPFAYLKVEFSHQRFLFPVHQPTTATPARGDGFRVARTWSDLNLTDPTIKYCMFLVFELNSCSGAV